MKFLHGCGFRGFSDLFLQLGGLGPCLGKRQALFQAGPRVAGDCEPRVLQALLSVVDHVSTNSTDWLPRVMLSPGKTMRRWQNRGVKKKGHKKKGCSFQRARSLSLLSLTAKQFGW